MSKKIWTNNFRLFKVQSLLLLNLDELMRISVLVKFTTNPNRSLVKYTILYTKSELVGSINCWAF